MLRSINNYKSAKIIHTLDQGSVINAYLSAFLPQRRQLFLISIYNNKKKRIRISLE